MTSSERFAYSMDRNAYGEAFLRPYLQLSLMHKENRVDVMGLLDTGSDINLMPFSIGGALGAIWSQQPVLAQISGTLADYEVRGLVVDATLGMFPPVQLAFAWIHTDDVRLLLGHANFLMEFDVCFFRADGQFEIRSR